MRRLIILMILVLTLIAGYTWSEAPPNKIPPIARQTVNSDNSKDISNQPQHTTIDFPPVVNLTVGGKLNINTTENKNHADTPSSKWIDPIAISTVLLVFVTAGLVLLSLHQLRTTRTTTRAYVRINSCSPGIIFYEQPRLACKLEIKNYGETPAHIIDIVIQTKISEVGQLLPAPPDFEGAKRYPCSNAFLVRGESIFYQFFDETIPAEKIADIKDRKIILNLYGYVDYIDAFGNGHRGGFGQNYYQPHDNRENYPSDEAFKARNNLTFLMQSGYNYDCRRKDVEGRD